MEHGSTEPGARSDSTDPGRGTSDPGDDRGDPNFPAATAEQAATVEGLDEEVATCRACPRLVEWREEVARVRRRAYRDWDYWARPVPGFGPPDAALMLVGLAPAAHGGNRTGRMFTGDPSGDALYAALHDVGLASSPVASHREDGLELRGVRITAPVHCAPPANRPTTTERDTCRPWLARELVLLRPTLRAIVALGGFAWQALLPVLQTAGWQLPRPRPAFGHGARVRLGQRVPGEALTGTGTGTDRNESGYGNGDGSLALLGCYHPSQRNTFTGRLTPAMLREVLYDAAVTARITDLPAPPPAPPER